MKDCQVRFVLTEAEKRALFGLAEADGGLSASAALRRLIRREAEQRGLWPVDAAGNARAQETEQKAA